MRIRLFLISTLLVMMFSACDLVDSARYYEAIDEYNSVENSADSNYWRRLYYTGDDFISDVSAYDIESVDIVVNGSLYVLGLRDNDGYFGSIDLETLEAESYNIPEITGFSEDYSDFADIAELYRGGDDILLKLSDEDEEIFSYYRYRTDTEEWDALMEFSDFDITRVVSNGRYFFLYQNSDGEYPVYEYVNHELTLLEIITPGNETTVILSNDSSFILVPANSTIYSYSDSVYTTILRFNFITDSFDEITLSDELTDSNDLESSKLFLTDTNILYNLRWDHDSSTQGEFYFSPITLDYVDLDGTLSWEREEYADSDFIRLGGESLEAALFRDDIYIIPFGYWYWDEDSESTRFYENTPVELFRINSADYSMESLGSFPGVEEEFDLRELEYEEVLKPSNGGLFLKMKSYTLGFEIDNLYIYDPDANEWSSVPLYRSIAWVDWNELPGEDDDDRPDQWHEGLYYCHGGYDEPQDYIHCIFSYTP